jgi:hypothetical protein
MGLICHILPLELQCPNLWTSWAISCFCSDLNGFIFWDIPLDSSCCWLILLNKKGGLFSNSVHVIERNLS